jgi:hypothetical protein
MTQPAWFFAAGKIASRRGGALPKHGRENVLVTDGHADLAVAHELHDRAVGDARGRHSG